MEDEHWDVILGEAPWDPDALSELVDIDETADPPVDDLLDELLRLHRQQARIAALQSEVLVRIAGAVEQRRPVTVLDHLTETEREFVIVDEAREEIAAALHRSPAVVHDQLVDARLMAGPLASTHQALAAGEITEQHARILCEQARRMLRSVRPDDDPRRFPEACRLLQERVLPAAAELTPAQTCSLAHRTVARIDADREQQRREHARRGADVTVVPEDDGMALLIARLPELDALRIGAVIDGHARTADLATPCKATIGERRAAALVDLVCGGDRVGDGSTPVAAVAVTVTMSLEEVLDPIGPMAGLLEDPRTPVTLRRLITDPRTGTALDLGRTRYAVSDGLRRWIVARDRTCTFPGCGRRATACDIDHVVAWDDGGPTDAANLQALCRRHHLLKTHGGWCVENSRDGIDRHWLSPRGRRYRARPPAVVAPVRAGTSPPEDDPPF